MKWLQIMAFAMTAFTAFSAVAAPATEEEMYQQFEKIKTKKMILMQVWMDRTPDVILKNLDVIKQAYDGVFLELYGWGHKDPRGSVANSRRVMQKDFEFKYEWFKDEIPKMQKIAASGLKHSFIGTTVRYGDLDWFNDEHWRIACANYGLMARLAREGGLMGIDFDPEQYADKIFNYQPYCGKSRHQVWMKARERGKQLITEIQKNYPGITIVSIFFHTLNYELLGTAYNNAYAQGNLFVPFLNGILDGLAPDTKLVEGNEYYTYKASSKRHFDFALAQERMLFNSQILPENRVKAKGQISYAPAIYMDAYFFTQKNAEPYHKAIYDVMTPGLEWNDPARMKAVYKNFPEVVNNSDEYIWVYQERPRYWGAEAKYQDGKLLHEVFPQLLPFIKAVKSPATLEQYWMERVKKEHIPNLLKGATFEDDTYKKWSFWQRAKNNHRDSGFFLDPTGGVNNSRGIVAKNLGKHGGSFFTKGIKVKPDTQYLLVGKIKRTQAGYGALQIMFQKNYGTWDYNTLTPLVKIVPRTMKEGEYETVAGIFTTPEYINMLGVSLSVSEQRNRYDFVYFDEIGLYELPTK